MKIINKAHKNFKKTLSHKLPILIVGLISLVFLYFITQQENPMWVVYWGFSFTYSAAWGYALWRRYSAYKRLSLWRGLNGYADYKWIINTTDGVSIGRVNTKDYLKAVYETDIDLLVKIKQLLNVVYILFSLINHVLLIMPGVLIFIVLCGYYFDIPYEFVTIGQIIHAKLLLYVFAIIFVVQVPCYMFFGGLSALPGYKNYREIKLRRLLSMHVPNIANAKGFSVVGYCFRKDGNDSVCNVTGK